MLQNAPIYMFTGVLAELLSSRPTIYEKINEAK